jgi:hypothetical protein
MLRKFAMHVVCFSLLACVVPVAGAQTFKFVGAGSSAMWQNFALAAYHSGTCPTGGTAPCKHYTGKGFLMHDSRSASISDETGNVWITWDSAATPNVWMYINVDSVVGTRCYFAAPRCTIKSPATFPAVANLITLAGAVWGGAAADVLPPASIQTALANAGAGRAVTAGMTDIRPEDAQYAQCRANSALDTTSTKKGLGYSQVSTFPAAGKCPVFADPVTAKVGNKITVNSAIGSNFAQTIAFNIKGTDPFTNTAVTSGTVVPVGAAPILFITRRTNQLKSVLNVTDTELQTAYTDFSAAGGHCDGGSLGGVAGGIWCYQREPLSGTMNTTEFSVFRNHPFQTLYSQEDGVSPSVAGNNPLAKVAGTGNKVRAIGTGQMVAQVKTSTAITGLTNFVDAIGYAFFSFGNVSSIANNASYGYLKLDGVDPIGLPVTSPAQELPGAPVAGTTCTTLPCTEAQLWGAGHFSFPGLRACTTGGNSSTGYRAWSVLRLVSDGANLTNAQVLVTGAQAAAVSQVPDFVPAKATTSGGITDPGLLCYRSHYLFSVSNTDGTTTSTAGNNGLVGVEAGRDEGGCIYKKPVSGAGVLNMGQEYAPLGVPNACAAPVFP